VAAFIIGDLGKFWAIFANFRRFNLKTKPIISVDVKSLHLGLDLPKPKPRILDEMSKNYQCDQKVLKI
jgi:hypothetical protein